MMDKDTLRKYSSSIISRLFSVIDLTKEATTDKDRENITKFIDMLALEIEGSLDYYSGVKDGGKMTSVLMKIRGVRTVSDFNVRKKVAFDSIGIIDKIIKQL